MYYVYLLKLSDGTIYVGSTGDLKTRFKKHNLGQVTSTKAKLPHKIIFYCALSTKQKALALEKYLKTGSGKAFRNKRLI